MTIIVQNSTVAFNLPLFRLYENLYMVLLTEYGESTAIRLFTKVMETGLQQAYDSIGFVKSDPYSFKQVITARDNAVGITVEFPEASNQQIIYQLFSDPFANLQGIVDCKLLTDAYIQFKVRYLLGDGWSYVIAKHFWLGDHCIEIIIKPKTKYN